MTDDREALRRHVLRMRVTAAVFLVAVAACGVAVFMLPRLRSALASPAMITLLALAGSLWIAFTVEGDARVRLERAKRGYAVHGEQRRLLREHWVVYIVVLLRLLVVALCGLVTAVWGLGPLVALCFVALTALLMALTWPTERKATLLLERGRRMM